MNLFSAWFVHLYTASGALAAFFGTLTQVFEGDLLEAEGSSQGEATGL